MSYQALARKYRPQSFAEVAGQQHALNSLVHALETQKVHHAYLFTGTRGVGKTTLGRLLAKCLNCKTGVTAEPCNKCENCVAINNNSFIDLIEIDAASRTGVEETKEILDNIQYMPSQGRYKVYLIDEVHMLSKQSFNALLKTLEEPPEYVKFILATTDYHKIPVTILSRCIQLHLKHISQADIKDQLKIILAKENINSDEQSLEYIAYHAKGSLRDALSLLDQAISFCGGELKQAQIKQMLGIIDSEEVYSIINAIIDNDPKAILPAIKNLALTESSADAVLDRIAEIWFACCIYSFTQSLDAVNDIDVDIINNILAKISIEQAHFLYQLTITAKKDIALAPNFETGVTMAILRLIAFQKKNLIDKTQTSKSNISPIVSKNDINLLKNTFKSEQPKQTVKAVVAQNNDSTASENTQEQSLDKKWFNLLNRIKLKGFTKTLAFNSHLISDNSETFVIHLNEDAKKILELDPQSIAKLQASISEYLNNPSFRLDIKNLAMDKVSTDQKSPAEIKRENAISKIHNDENTKLIKQALAIDIKDQNIILTD
ncbi:DNA polymerase III subunit gamma/tau [Francisella tularensis]|uniref:DNA polymerase III subunit gamma/tau n=1 Tax=Francisella tularensis TaxID=263 RepID=UPI0000F59377|nr:DNA polymerase III subunit gamma/tau [Francisella tularensis]ABO47550.1 DNA polymerase III subunit gamma/tau [Francisella tularensis subsp. tularensis WY96-3418]AJI63278.1 DNA polymerase III, subunit gamma and tau [Francisella tularensis subsp. tularensis]AKH92722.1 DNA polymerase III subunits gamma and tau [Francisella tularensis subsp. tularensis WY-00W4114]AKU73627.1 DNA polymerase III, subunit gamma and tau [Francisella tularensis subsp. tularensis]KFJ64832.1 DNA polymerase III, subunit